MRHTIRFAPAARLRRRERRAPEMRENTIGILAMIAAMASLIINDTFVKLAGADVPLGQIIFLRGLIATIVIGAFTWRLGEFAGSGRLLRPSVGLRLGGEVSATVFYLYALLHLPLAVLTSILQALPIVLTAIAVLYYRETVGWRRWIATLIGFAGVIAITRPTQAGFGIWYAFAIAALLFVGVRDIATRDIPKDIPTNLLTTITAAAVSVLGATLGLLTDEPWVALDLRQFIYIVLAGLFILGGYVFNVIAMRNGALSVVTPFRYSIVIWALMLGWLVWGEIPDGPALAGMVTVILAGLYIYYREHTAAGPCDAQDRERG